MSGNGDGCPVLVGYDGSVAADQALHWAVQEAQLRDLPLIVCHAWQWPYPFSMPDEDALDILHGAGAIVADEGVRKAHAIVAEAGVRKARALATRLEVRRILERGSASAVLLQASRDATLIVLGARGQGGFEGLTVGSTAVQVAAHADRPAIVVRRAPAGDRPDARIVVGVDGSPAGRAALGFAFHEAELRGAPLCALCGWWDPAALPSPDRAPFIDAEKIRREAINKFEQAVKPWRAEYPEVAVDAEFVVDTPRHALTKASEDAGLLVVGNRGIGSTPQALLGPVPQYLLQRAACTVAVVPPHQPW
ncbi:universal stress protein [Actinomadura rubrobrunea]|uniref:Universal stress protein n=1 Tax=Actinomadura rubrobrunea TaxID=115335 RepID=A0A9W6UZU0_9ACTN|nr:universal stress protein [Actinomadura rubrobrunea]GLW67130.1 universal stress protein [Actinomadura rubrobrunea]